MPPTELLTMAEFQMMLRLSKPTVARYRARQLFPVVKIGGRVFVTRADAEAFIAAHRVPARDDDGREATRPAVTTPAGGGGGDDPG